MQRKNKKRTSRSKSEKNQFGTSKSRTPKKQKLTKDSHMSLRDLSKNAKNLIQKREKSKSESRKKKTIKSGTDV